MTTAEKRVLRQPTRMMSVRIDVLNSNDIVIDSFDGMATDGSIAIDAESVYRRSGNITLILDEKHDLLPSPSSNVWLDKRCAIHIGLDSYEGRTIWFNMGRFAINNVDVSIEGAEKTVKLELKDYMSFLDGTLGGELSRQTVLPRSSITISEAIRTVLSDLGRVSIEDIGVRGSQGMIPYDIEKPSGSTVYELAKELVDLYKGYDFYFNEEGYLVVEKIRDHKNSPIIESFDGDRNDFTINNTTSIDFENIRNSVWVWGDQLDDGTQPMWVYRNKYSKSTYAEMNRITDKETGDICHVSSTDISYVWSDMQYMGIAVSENPIPPVSPRSYNWSKVQDSDGVLEGNEYVHVKYSNDAGRTFTSNKGEDVGVWVGTYTDNNRVDSDKPKRYTWVMVNREEDVDNILRQYVWIAYSSYDDGGRMNGSDMYTDPRNTEWEILDFRVIPQFSIEKIGEKTKVINKSNVFNEAQARLEAEYHMQQHSNFAETVSLSTVPLYNLDVNKKIHVDTEGGIKGNFLITGLSIAFDSSSPMSITGRRLYD